MRPNTSSLKIISIPPHRWQGERGCAVGPFPNRLVANAFAIHILYSSYVPTRPEDLFVRENAYYIKVATASTSDLRTKQSAAWLSR